MAIVTSTSQSLQRGWAVSLESLPAEQHSLFHPLSRWRGSHVGSGVVSPVIQRASSSRLVPPPLHSRHWSVRSSSSAAVIHSEGDEFGPSSVAAAAAAAAAATAAAAAAASSRGPFASDNDSSSGTTTGSTRLVAGKGSAHQSVLRMAMPTMTPPRRLRIPSLAAPITWTLMVSYILIMLIVPISALLAKAAAIPFDVFMERALEPVAVHAYEVTFTMAAAAAAINCVFGFLLAWVLVKYEFPGKKWIDAAVDLPFALPTSVAGLTLSTVYGDEALLGQLLAKMGIRVVFTKLGVAVAMVFVSFPFVVRTMQPVLQEMEKELEEAAWTLGASPWRTFTDVVLPPLLPSLLTGTALAFSRALGEFGSIAIIASNFAFKDLIAPVLIFQALEQYDFVGATVVGTVLLLASLTIMLAVNKLQSFGSAFRK